LKTKQLIALMVEIKPKIAVVLINYKDYASRFLPASLESLRNQTYPKDRFKIFITDNETSSETQEYLKQTAPEAQLILNQGNDGFAKGNNDAFKVALEQGYDYCVSANMDTLFDSRWLAELVEAAQKNPEAGAVQSKILLSPEKVLINSIGNSVHYLGFGFCDGYRQPDHQIDGYPEIGYFSGAAVIFPRQVLERVGLYDDDYFMYYEDVDLSLRISFAGYKVILAPRSVMYHKYEFARSTRQAYWMERNRVRMLVENLRIRTLLLLLPAHLIMELGTLLYALKAGVLKQKFKVYGYFLKPQNIKEILKSRRYKQARRVLNDRVIWQRCVSEIKFQEIENPLLKYVGNPFLKFYWSLVKRIIVW